MCVWDISFWCSTIIIITTTTTRSSTAIEVTWAWWRSGRSLQSYILFGLQGRSYALREPNLGGIGWLRAWAPRWDYINSYWVSHSNTSYAAHNLSTKGLYGKKPSSSSGSANSFKMTATSSLGTSSAKLDKRFSNSANIMVPFSFLS